jgi:hypothetical protein
MQANKATFWAGVAIIEAIVILALFVFVFPTRVRFKKKYVPAVINPLRLALDYDLPDDKFEQLVKSYPNWISFRTHYEGGFNSSLLADCAMLRRTNFVRILITNGADVEEAVRENMRLDKDSVELLRQIQGETNRHQFAPAQQ